jgi:formamidopyrimidine-DNA glycosylase
MPERPDLEYVVGVLDRELRGRSVTVALLQKPVVLRLALEGDLQSLCEQQRFVSVRRVSHFVRFGLVDATTRKRKPTREIVVSPMLAGRFG